MMLTVDEFCRSYRISRSLFYKLQRTSRGPPLVKVGTRTLIRVDEAAEWSRRL
jgi:hypothetical protein